MLRHGPFILPILMLYSLRLFILASVLALLATGSGHAQSGPAASAETVTQAAAPRINPDSTYINPETRPRFPGGDQAFAEYLTKAIRYPKLALDRGISGRVYVSFVLNTTGKVVDAHVLRGPDQSLNDEALRLVWLMPSWEPARVNGQPVRVACTIPIGFNAGR